LKRPHPFLSAMAAAFLTSAPTVTMHAQAPTTPPQPNGGSLPAHHHEEPAPTNLKVLPKTMTGEQVHDLMHKWEAALGTECSTCHTADPTKIGPNGKPRLDFADDSKKEKQAARLMYRMTEEINTQWVNMVENSGAPVTCGTCHRGHLTPEVFVPLPDHEHGHEAPPSARHE